MAPDVVITWPCGRFIDSGFSQCLSAMQVHDAKASHRILDVLSLISSPLIAEARNQLTEAALRTNAQWVLMLDADMAFPIDTLDRLLEAADPDEAPIVSGLYFGGKPEGPAIPHAYVRTGDDEAAFDSVRGTKGPDRPGEYSGFGPVNMVGAGCLLVHRDALERIHETFAPTGMPWFANAVRGDKPVGEDVVFCMRAEAVGIPIHVLYDLTLGHIKTGVVDERTHRRHLDHLAEGWSESELEQDWGSRFRYNGFKDLAAQNLEAKDAEMVARVQGKVESMLATNGQKP